MAATDRLRRGLAVGAATAAAAAGCGTATEGVPDAKIITALQMKRVQGHYAIKGNPFCSVSKLLHDARAAEDRVEAHALAFHVGRPINTILEWENIEIWAGRPGEHYFVMPPDCARDWPNHITAARLEEVEGALLADLLSRRAASNDWLGGHFVER